MAGNDTGWWRLRPFLVPRDALQVLRTLSGWSAVLSRFITSSFVSSALIGVGRDRTLFRWVQCRKQLWCFAQFWVETPNA
jgi:hypothetical protein